MFIPDDYALIKTSFRLFNDPYIVATITYGVTGYGGASASALAANASASARISNSIFEAGAAASSWQLFKSSATKMVAGAPVFGDDSVVTTGTNGIQPPTPNVAVIVKKVTSLGGREGRGRFFMPPFLIDEGDVTPRGMIDPTLLADIQARADEFYDQIVSNISPGGPVLFHADPLVTPTVIDSFQVEPLVATQRRRLRR